MFTLVRYLKYEQRISLTWSAKWWVSTQPPSGSSVSSISSCSALHSKKYLNALHLQCCGSRSAFIWVSWIRIRIQEHGNCPKLYSEEFSFPVFQKAFCEYVFDLLRKGIFQVRIFVTRIRIRIGLAPWIRIEIKSRIRIRIETNADPQHCAFGTSTRDTYLYSICLQRL